MISRSLHWIQKKRFCLLLLLMPVCSGGILYAGDNEAFVLIENRTEHIAKVAVPGAKPVRVKPGEDLYRLVLDPVEPNGVDAKAWWVSSPRQLCVIFVRYGGKVVIAGKKDIKCLGN